MTYYVGLDVGLRSSSVCNIDDQGAICLVRDVPSEIEPIAACVRSFDREVAGLALETGNLPPRLTAGLRAEGFHVVVMQPRQVKTTLSSKRNKTDRLDARGKAQILRTGWYLEVHVKSLESQRRITLSNAMSITPSSPRLQGQGKGQNMGHFSAEIYAPPGSTLSGNQHSASSPHRS